MEPQLHSQHINISRSTEEGKAYVKTEALQLLRSVDMMQFVTHMTGPSGATQRPGRLTFVASSASTDVCNI